MRPYIDIKTRGLITSLLFLICLFSGIASASEGSARKVIVVALGYGIEAKTLFSDPSPKRPDGSPWAKLKELRSQGVPGLMNTTTAGVHDRADSYASSAFGTRAKGGNISGVVQGIGRGTLKGFRTIRELNAKDANGYGAVPGILSATLEKADIRLAVFGNADLIGKPHREIGFFGVDKEGRMPGSSFTGSYRFPETLRLLGTWMDDLSDKDERGVAFVELGTGSQSTMARRLASVFGEVSRNGSPDIGFIFASVGPQQSSGDGTLTPVIAWHLGFEGGDDRVLASPSTRRTGVVCNTDLVPTCLDNLGVSVPKEMTGRGFISVKPSSLKGRSAGEWLLSLQESAVAKTKLRIIFVTAYVISIIFCVAYLTIAFAIRRRTGPLTGKHARLNWPWYPLLVMCWPVVMLVLAYWSPIRVVDYSFFTIVGLLPVFMFKSQLSKDPKKTIPTLALLLGGLVLADQFSGGALIARTVMSYDLQSGSRFYGLGNEYMGLIVGAAICWMGFKHEDKPMALNEMLLTAILLSFVIGAPVMGANVGGLITCVLGFGATILIFRGRELNALAVLALFALAFLAVAGMSALDTGLLGSSTSHLGRSILHAGSEGLTGALRILTRKFQMNLRMMAYTPWSYVFVVVLAYLFWLTRPASRTRAWLRVRSGHPGLSKALRGALLASAVAFVFNDSGIVASSLLMVYPFFGFAFLLLIEENDREDNRT